MINMDNITQIQVIGGVHWRINRVVKIRLQVAANGVEFVVILSSDKWKKMNEYEKNKPWHAMRIKQIWRRWSHYVRWVSFSMFWPVFTAEISWFMKPSSRKNGSFLKITACDCNENYSLWAITAKSKPRLNYTNIRTLQINYFKGESSIPFQISMYRKFGSRFDLDPDTCDSPYYFSAVNTRFDRPKQQ